MEHARDPRNGEVPKVSTGVVVHVFAPHKPRLCPHSSDAVVSWHILLPSALRRQMVPAFVSASACRSSDLMLTMKNLGFGGSRPGCSWAEPLAADSCRG